MRAIAFALLTCCAHTQGARSVKVEGVLTEKPPLPVDGILFEACPEPTVFAACLTKESATRLAKYMAELQRYSNDAWTTCRKD